MKHDCWVHGEIQQCLPLMGVRQEKGETHKVRPVLDYWHLNETLESYPGGTTPLCADRLRKWRQLSSI